MLHRLLGLDFPADSELTSLGVALRGGLPLWAVGALAVAAALAAAAVYRRERADLPGRTRWLLAGLRAAALAVLVALIARPAVVAEAQGRRPRPVAVLVDNSASLRQADRRSNPADLLRVAIALGQAPPDADPDGEQWQSAAREELAQTPRLELVKSVLNSSRIDLIGRLEKQNAVKAYLVGSKPRRVATRGIDRAIAADEQRTALWDTVREVVASPDTDTPAAVVLLTDGLDNASQTTAEELAAELKKLNVALHIYGVGSTDSGAVRLVDAAVPDTLFLDDAANIPVRFLYRGPGNPAAIVTITLAGREVARQEVKLSAGEGRATINFVPDKRIEGTADLGVAIRLKNDAGSADELHKPVTISERKVRVLIVDDAPRWEFKFLQPALSRDRRVAATYFVAQGDPRALKGEPFLPAFPTRDKLFGFDLVILGDVPPSVLGPDGVATLADFVREGGGLVVIAGRKAMPADYADTPLAEVLPVEFVPVRFPPAAEERTTAYRPELTTAGRRSPLTSLADTPEENERLWNEELPGFYWRYPVTKLRPGATALLTVPKKAGDEAPQPVMATQYYGKGPVLFLAGEETWRWRYNTGDRLYSRFWGQIVYQLGLPHLLGLSSRVQLTLDRSDAVVGRPGYVYARLLDGDYRPFLADKIPAVIEQFDPPATDKTKSITLDPVPGRPGEYRALLPHDTAGRFEVSVQQPESCTLPFRVQFPPGHELEPAGLNETTLRALTEATGGGFYREEDLLELPGKVETRYAPYTVRQEALLWGPLPLGLLIALFTAEWIVRKLANLS
jgi:hypothetical protein